MVYDDRGGWAGLPSSGAHANLVSLPGDVPGDGWSHRADPGHPACFGLPNTEGEIPSENHRCSTA